METATIIETERRRSLIALVAVIAAGIFLVVGQALAISAIGQVADIGEQLRARSANSGTVIGAGIAAAIGQALLVFPLLLLFDAARARSGSRLDRFRLLVMLGPPVLAIAGVATAFGFDSVAADFVAGSDVTGEVAEDRAQELFADDPLVQFGFAAGLAGIIATVFGVIYSALWGMRTGLLTRFWGTLGMAFGAFLFLIIIAPGVGPVGVLGTLFFLLHASLLAGDRWPGTRPPAWDAGVAVPWDERDSDRFGFGPPAEEEEGEELARPEDFEPGDADPTERPGRRDNRRKRKRKQRKR